MSDIVELLRDRYGRPLVIPPGGGKPVAYTRCTTYVGVLEDTYNLSKWMQRQVALGLSLRPDLIGMVHAKQDDKNALNAVCQDAMEAAKASAAANTGTAIHALTEQVDTGGNLADLPADFRPDVEAYLRATRHLAHEHIETFCVLDELKIGGTPDRISRCPDGRLRIVDLKTGSVDYGIGKIAMQLAVYAHSMLYDLETGERREIDVDLEVGYVVHVPAGTGTSRLLEVDIAAGWEAVQVATQVRAWRSRKGLAREIDLTDEQAQADGLPDDVDQLRRLWQERPDLRERIEAKVSAA